MPAPNSVQTTIAEMLFTNSIKSTSDLPDSFPDVEPPHFREGDRLRWLSDEEITDWGIVVGRFYNFDPCYDRWHWCYLIVLAPDSPSCPWVGTDIAWQDDLQTYDEITADVPPKSEL